MNADAFSKTLDDVTYHEPERIFLYICWNYEGCFGSQKNADFSIQIIFWCQIWCHPWCQKEKGQRLNTSDQRF